MKILNIVGARPNFMKMAPIIDALDQFPDQFEHRLVHTGQHYDARMSQSFFDDLGMPRPDVDLGVGSASHARQTARIMTEFEKVCEAEQPDLVIVVGDVNSTIACALTATKLGIEVAHVEAGLRSRDRSMPEEINRLCTDAISDLLFTTDPIAGENLLSEGVAPEKIHFVGNVMIDTLNKHRAMAERLSLIDQLGLRPGEYATVTLHRPANVDDPAVLEGILSTLAEIGRTLPLVLPIHPRTKKMAEQFGLSRYFNEGRPVRGLWITEPLGYLEFLHLNMHARMVLTDSGGLQEETTVLGVPCITMRDNTERPITCEIGSNVLVGNRPENIMAAAKRVLEGDVRPGRIPDRWDGAAAIRIVETLRKLAQA